MNRTFLFIMKEILKGLIQGNRNGYAFLINSNGNDVDYFIPHGNLRGAMHGDVVLAVTTNDEGERTTARVLKVVERGITELVGTYFSTKGVGYVVPDDDKYFNDVFISKINTVRPKSGDKVVCKIVSYPKNKNPEGIVVKIFGQQFNRKAELASILYKYKLPHKFSSNVLTDVEQLNEKIEESDLIGRKDFRNELIFTIDGADAKDFDDAVSIKKLKNGYRLGVHIADVTHYVKDGGFIDAEAFNRGTSVYFPESVIPMLPEKLCNDLCSLRPNEDRLTLSCVVDIDFNGKIIDREIVKSVITSKYRLTYDFVQEILDGSVKFNDDNLVNSLFLMDELSDLLKSKRDEKGNIDLEVKESAIKVDSCKIEVSLMKKNKAHKIIEEFMILANVIVAEFAYFLEMPFVYRVHAEPSEEKVKNLFAFLDGLGIKHRNAKSEVHPKDFQKILSSVDENLSSIVNRVMLRSMQKAKYSCSCDGHFGLSEQRYCHFTSPIRRYPDLTIHRIIKDFLDKGVEFLDRKYSKSILDVANQSSETERRAHEAEMEVDDYYKLLYISNFVGEEFDGVVIGITSSGIFVELDNCIEGFVNVKRKKGGNVVFNKEKYTLTFGKRSYRLGQRVSVRVDQVNLIDKRAEFILLK